MVGIGIPGSEGRDSEGRLRGMPIPGMVGRLGIVMLGIGIPGIDGSDNEGSLSGIPGRDGSLGSSGIFMFIPGRDGSDGKERVGNLQLDN